MTKADVKDKPKSEKKLTAVSKKGSRIQVVSKNTSQEKKSIQSRLSSSTGGGGGGGGRFGGMRCDMEENQPRKPVFNRTNLKSMKFQVKGGESELLGIDLKKVSLKRKIQNDDSTTKVSVRSGELKRTVPNKRGSDSDDPSPKKTPRAIHEKSKAIYKTALNDLMENRKKSRGDLEVRKRASRNKLKEMQDSSESDVPVVKRKKLSKKKPKESTSEESSEEHEAEIRRPGERGKSAAKELIDDGGDGANSPVEGYRLKVSNLNASVSESDLVDLFCAIGAIRDAKLTPDPGAAVITFVKRAAAMAAITKYNGRELDKQKIMVVAHRVMDLPAKKPYQWRNEYPTKKPRIRQELVGEIHPAILPPSLAGIVTPGAKPVVFTVKV